MADEIKATFRLKYDCKNSRRYECVEDDFVLNDVYILRPWSNHVVKFEITIKALGE